MIEGSRIYIPAIYVINKIDQITLEELNVISKLPHYCPVCAYLEWNLDGLVDMIWEYLDLIRVYTKPKVSYKNPTYSFPWTPLPFSAPRRCTIVWDSLRPEQILDRITIYTTPKGVLQSPLNPNPKPWTPFNLQISKIGALWPGVRIPRM